MKWLPAQLGPLSMGNERRSSMPKSSAATTVQTIGLMMKTIITMIQLGWKKCGRQNGGPINN
jgi:hypothetical protein